MVNVRAEESRQVRYLILYYFLQGLGLALFFTAANTIFLSAFKPEDLPVAYMSAAVALMLAGKTYEYLEHKYSAKTRSLILIFIGATVLLLFAGREVFAQAGSLAYAMFIWYRVVYNVCDLEFWGFSAQVFDTRQAKRLFGLISAGEAPAKVIGYFSVFLLSGNLRAHHLLIISSLAFFLCYVVVRRLLATHHVEDHGHDHAPKGHGHPVKETLLKFFSSEYILYLGLLYVAGAITLTVVEFSFLTEVEEKFHTEHDIEKFFGLVLGIGNVVIFVSKLFFSSRLIARIGVRWSLLSLPIFVLLVCIIVAFAGLGHEVEHQLMIFYVVLVIGGDLFKAILYEPLFLTLFQPLSTHLRLKAHVVVKGFVDPLGLGLTGLGIFIILKFFDHIDLYRTDFVLLAFTLAWIVLVIGTYRKYITVLKTAIGRRTIESRELDLYDKGELEIIKQKLKSLYPEEVIYAHKLLSKNDEAYFTSSITDLLRHPAVEVREYALDKLTEGSLPEGDDILLTMANTDSSVPVRCQAMMLLCKYYNDDNVEHYNVFLEKEDPKLQYAAMKGLFESGNLEGIMLAGQKLSTMLTSKDKDYSVVVATLIGDMRFKNYFKPLLKFLEDDSYPTQKAAIEAAGKIAHIKLLAPLVSLLGEKKLKKDTVLALSKYGDHVVSYLASNPDVITANPFETCSLCAHIDTPASFELLLNFVLPKAEAEVLDECLRSLYQMHQQLSQNGRRALDHKLSEQVDLMHLCHHCRSITVSADKVLFDAVNAEIKGVKYRLLLLLSLLHDKATFRNIISNLVKGSRQRNANAIEMLDNILDNQYKQKMLHFFESSATSDATDASIGKTTFSGGALMNKLHEIVLLKRSEHFLLWTKAVVIYTSTDKLGVDVVKKYGAHRDLILRQIIQNRFLNDGSFAVKAQNSNIMQHNEESTANALLEIEKILVLKSVPMFAETPESILSGISEIMREQRIEAHTTIFKEGELGDCLYIIYDGSVSIHNEKQELAKMGSRDIFGELALLDPEPRSASATTLTDCMFLRIDKEDFDELMESRPEIMQGIISILAKRIRGQNKMIRDLNVKTQAVAAK